MEHDVCPTVTKKLEDIKLKQRHWKVNPDLLHWVYVDRFDLQGGVGWEGGKILYQGRWNFNNKTIVVPIRVNWCPTDRGFPTMWALFFCRVGGWGCLLEFMS
ncbi:hypothetical protein L1987_15993 [Smallanthus sonchifolius]|uniref:Uncharacterized protein n=1 Tax=Smallanthus sonchifolius TaxID=185202 RepID=A0ACB9J7M9_9ASTR|nr:hypothetical protein L1987_15993 [Smallanthus sonchifolius]